MKKDVSWTIYFEDDERYADLVNAKMGNKELIIKKEDVLRYDTRILTKEKKTSRKKEMSRDIVRKIIFGVNFCIINIENQETVDYGYPLRNMGYIYGEYDAQARKIRRQVRKEKHYASPGEFMYGFKKNSKLKPTIVFLLYSGVEEWDGAKSLKEMLDMTDVPEDLDKFINDHSINLIDIRRLTDEEIAKFTTDVGKVFDFIRCAQDKKRLKQIVENDGYYSNMQEDAYDVVTNYASIKYVNKKDYATETGGINMCKAIDDMIEDGRKEGIKEATSKMQLLVDERDKTIEELRKEIEKLKKAQ